MLVAPRKTVQSIPVVSDVSDDAHKVAESFHKLFINQLDPPHLPKNKVPCTSAVTLLFMNSNTAMEAIVLRVSIWTRKTFSDRRSKPNEKDILSHTMPPPAPMGADFWWDLTAW